MRSVSEELISCPFCGETASVLVDLSAGDQEYVEDCEVCCRPLVLSIAVGGDGAVDIVARNENE